MKNILFFLLACFMLSNTFWAKAQSSKNQDPQPVEGDTAVADSLVNVVAYFAKGDTCDYWIAESKWRVNGKDTTKISDIRTKVRLVVTDSTANGYKMTYTFTDVVSDSTVNSLNNKLLGKIADNLKRYVIGTTIQFETDEYGAITKINNLSQIKKQAKTLFKKGMKEITTTSEIKSLKSLGIDIANFAKDVDVDALVEGYLEELKMLFICHGGSYKIGKFEEHEDATDEDYESDTYRSVLVNDDGNYTIDVDVVSVIPQSDLKDLVGGVVDLLKDKSVTEKFDKEFDSQVKEDGSLESRMSVNCYNDGWPCEVVKQTFVKIGELERVNQTVISACYFSAKK